MWVFFTFCTFRDFMFTLKNSVTAQKKRVFKLKPKLVYESQLCSCYG